MRHSTRKKHLFKRTAVLKQTRGQHRIEKLRKNNSQRLRQTTDEEYYNELIVNSQQDTLFIFSPITGKTIKWNAVFREITGYSDDEIAAMKAPDDFYSVEDLKKASLAIDQLKDTGIAKVELSLIPRIGAAIPFEYSAKLATNSNNEPVIISVGRELTQRYKMEQALRRTNRALLALSRVNQELVHSYDKNEIDFLKSICRIIVDVAGYQFAWVGYAQYDEAKTVLPIAQAGLTEDYLGSIRVCWSDCTEGRGPTGTAIRTGTCKVSMNIHDDANLFPWHKEAQKRGYNSAIAIPLKINGGHCFGALSIYSATPETFDKDEMDLLVTLGEDLSYGIDVLRARKQQMEAEEELKQSRERLLRAQNIAKLCNWELDKETDEMLWSHQVYHLLGVSSDHFDGPYEKFLEVVHPEDREMVNTAYSNHRENGTPINIVHRIIRRGGDVRYIRHRSEIVSKETPAPIRIVGTLQDITQQVLTEKKNRELESRLFQSQKMEAIGTLAGGIAHDFNNILSAIIGFSQLLDREIPNDSHLKPKILQVLKGGRRAKELVKQILTFSHHSELRFETIQLHIIVKEVLKLMRATLPSTIRFKQDIDKDHCTIKGDAVQIHQVLMNLCTNAAHAMRDNGGVLEITLKRLEADSNTQKKFPGMQTITYAKLSVSDTGHGMEAHVRERIFEPFFTTRTKNEGTGLGLSMVHGIIKNHNGVITVESEPGTGSTFTVYLPIISHQSDSKEEMPNDTVLPKGKNKEHILFVDDEEALVTLYRALLEELNYTVSATTSSQEALEQFRKNPEQFDMVITDLTMPVLTGDKLAVEMLRLRPTLPIILCTGYSAKLRDIKSGHTGICRFLMKPLLMDELAVTIRDILDKESRTKK